MVYVIQIPWRVVDITVPFTSQAIWKEVVLLTHNHHIPLAFLFGDKKTIHLTIQWPHVGHGRLVVQKPPAWQVGGKEKTSSGLGGWTL